MDRNLPVLGKELGETALLLVAESMIHRMLHCLVTCQSPCHWKDRSQSTIRSSVVCWVTPKWWFGGTANGQWSCDSFWLWKWDIPPKPSHLNEKIRTRPWWTKDIDTWWYMLTHADTCWYMMIHNDTWWYMEIHDVTWWYMMIHEDTRLYTMIHDDTRWYTMVHDGTRWYTMIHHDTPWYTMIHHDTPRYTMIHHDTPWYTMIHDDTRWYMMIHDDTWWYMMIHNDNDDACRWLDVCRCV